MYKVGDKVRIVEHHTGAMNRLMDKWLGKVMTIREVDDGKTPPYKMEEDQQEFWGNGWFWDDEMIAGLAETITIEIDPTDKATAHKSVEEAIAEHQRKVCEWTEAEIEEATRLSDEMILELHHRHLSPVFYHWPNGVLISLNFGEPRESDRAIIASPKGDPFNDEIGRCVCLCKATGREIPEFIQNKNRGRKR